MISFPLNLQNVQVTDENYYSCDNWMCHECMHIIVNFDICLRNLKIFLFHKVYSSAIKLCNRKKGKDSSSSCTLNFLLFATREPLPFHITRANFILRKIWNSIFVEKINKYMKSFYERGDSHSNWILIYINIKNNGKRIVTTTAMCEEFI